MEDGAAEIQWAPRVRQEDIRRLYEIDAQGIYDEQLIDPDAFAALDPTSVLIQHGSAVDAAADHDPVAASYVFE